VKAVKKFVARISTFSALKVPLIEGTMVQLHVGHAEVAASVSRLVSLLDRTGAVKKVRQT
jgi:translation elongation factor EF-1alpha